MNFARRAATWFGQIPGRIRHASRARLAVTGAVLLAIIGVSVGFAVSDSNSPPPKAQATTTTVAAHVVTARCPLTDAPPPSGTTVPQRPALLVKIGNEPDGARPQSGLNEADIVFDTPAEGFIMRYVAVYQCDNASSIGPTRSVRWVDWNMIAPQFGTPILAFAGGIDPNVNGLSALPWLSGANLLEGAQAAGVRISSRVAPDNLYTSTGALYGLYKSKTAVPAPVFDFATKLPPGSTPASSVGIYFSGGTDPVWKWDGKSGLWLHTYSGSPDVDVASNTQVSTTNIVLQVVHYSIGPYSEHGCCSGDIQSELVGTGAGYVFRDGRVFKVTWQRPSVTAKTTFVGPDGKAVDLAPGRTWVELDPDTQADAPGGITITP